MPTLRDRVVKLEKRANDTDERVEALESWLTDESALRELDEKRIDILEQAKLIHERRLKSLATLAGLPKKRRR